MKIMIIDTETTGLLPKKCKPVLDEMDSLVLKTDSLDFPYIVQLSYVVFETETQQIEKIVNHVIRVPDHVIISDFVANIHGITNEISKNIGIPIQNALSQMIHDFHDSNIELIVCHNTEFDIHIILIELFRMKTIETMVDLEKEMKMFYKTTSFCTMKNNEKRCQLKKTYKNGKTYNKYPKLIELHQHLFFNEPKQCHNALNDVLICLRCFYFTQYNVDLLSNKSSVISYFWKNNGI
jgi:DNA polymerase III epsilon subunit-like protein